MDLDIAEWRRDERRRLLEARQQPTAGDYSAWSDAISSHLMVQLAEFGAAMLGFYWPYRSEYDPMPIVKRIIAQGGHVALPVVVAKGQPLEYREWYPGIAMTTGRFSFDIPHPAEGPPVTPGTLLVPLLGFDKDAYRLGYGGGYFDRTLAACAVRPQTIGVGFEFGRMETIHPQSHDIPMDIIVTELGVFTKR